MTDINEMIDDSRDEVVYSEDLSNCCGAPIYSDTDICSKCKEHCEVEDESR